MASVSVTRKYTVIALAAVSLSLGACASNGQLQIPAALTPTAINADVAQVQSIAQGLCGWREPLSVLAQIIATFAGGSGVVASANEIASQVCAAVTPAAHGGSLHGARAPSLHGIRLQGHRV